MKNETPRVVTRTKVIIEDGSSPDELIIAIHNAVNEVPEEFRDKIRISPEHSEEYFPYESWPSHRAYLEMRYSDFETAAERVAREDAESRNVAQREKYERDQYEALKKKFDKT